VWLQSLRKSSLESFKSMGYPSMKNEDWHFTNVAPISSRTFHTAADGSPVGAEMLRRVGFGQECHTVVIVNGRVDPRWALGTLPTGLSITTLASEIDSGSQVVERHFAKLATPESGTFTALNAALAEDGAVIRLAANTILDTPIHLVFLSDAGAEGARTT
jgi:Fe-S cluster assembly protein SufD